MPSKKAIRLVSKLPGFSGSTIEAFEEGLPKFKKFYREVEPYVRVSRKKVKKVSDMLSGQSVAFTGFRDKALEKKIVENGGKVSSGVSSTTTILLMKDPSSSSSKAQRAKSLGIKLMTPEQFTNKYGL
jgi:NAD-dependent DNA ligase